MLRVIFSIRGACMGEEYPNREIRSGRISSR